LNSSGFKTIRSVAVAKTFFLAVEEDSAQRASEVAHKIAKEFLCNPVSHVYTLASIREEEAPR
jgi:phosphoribosylformylglycinamidine (FGAM) synthase PurS component